MVSLSPDGAYAEGDVRLYLDENRMREAVKTALCTGLKHFAKIRPDIWPAADGSYTTRDTQHAHEGEVCAVA